MRGAQCETDHHLIRSTVNMKLRKYFPKRKNPRPLYDTAKLKEETLKIEYISKLETYYSTGTPTNVNDHWNKIKEAYTTAATNTLGINKTKREDWYDEFESEIALLLEKKRQCHHEYLRKPTHSNRDKYKAARQDTQKEVRRIRENWWISRTSEIQNYMDKGDSFNLYRSINSIIGPVKKTS